MIPPATLAMSGRDHARLEAHLFPGDGCEAAAILLCTSGIGPRQRLLVREVLLVPHDHCNHRTPMSITWPGMALEAAIDRAEADQLSIILLHSHPGGWFEFSGADDESDALVVPTIFAAHGELHGSAVMIPGGAIRARIYDRSMQQKPVDLVTVTGTDIHYWWYATSTPDGPVQRPLAFTDAMAAELGRLTAVVMGASGTGSPTAEQLARLGFGRVVVIDFDHLEHKNLNRVLNSTTADADQSRLKVDVLAGAIARYRGHGVAVPVAADLLTREAVVAASQADVLFCGVDSETGRAVADQIASAFLLPLIDMGVAIPTRKIGMTISIADVCGRIDYVQPGGARLSDRGVYTAQGLRAEYLARVAPDAVRQEVRAGYLPPSLAQAPAVISLNMRTAAQAVTEFLARAYPFRHESNARFARTEFSLAAGEEEFSDENVLSTTTDPLFARGAKEPLLGLPVLAPRVSSVAVAPVVGMPS